MAFFGVTREKIGEIKNHPNADRLEIAKLQGVNFSFIIPKGQYQVGQYILYFPLDAILPLNTAKAVGLEGKLAGKNKDRIKSVRLRGEISQGVALDVDESGALILGQSDGTHKKIIYGDCFHQVTDSHGQNT